MHAQLDNLKLPPSPLPPRVILVYMRMPYFSNSLLALGLIFIMLFSACCMPESRKLTLASL